MDKKYVEFRAQAAPNGVDFDALAQELRQADISQSYVGLVDVGGAYRVMFQERVRKPLREAVLAVVAAHTGQERHLGRAKARVGLAVRAHSEALRAQGFEYPAASGRMYSLDAGMLAELAGYTAYSSYPVVYRSMDGRHAARFDNVGELGTFAAAAWARLGAIRTAEDAMLRDISAATTPEGARAVLEVV